MYRAYCIWIVRHGGHLTRFMRSGSSFYTGSVSHQDEEIQTLKFSPLLLHLEVYAVPWAALSVLSLLCSSEGECCIIMRMWRGRLGLRWSWREPHLGFDSCKYCSLNFWRRLRGEVGWCFGDVTHSQISGSVHRCHWSPLCQMYNW